VSVEIYLLVVSTSGDHYSRGVLTNVVGLNVIMYPR